MPRKLNYTVVGSTGEMEGYYAKNLEDHHPTVSGWQTQRFCVYPQELIIRLKQNARIKKLQLLAHQYMIPSKIEFYVGNNDSLRNFKRLGYIYLSSNEKTGYKSRELKSVHVDADGAFLKLVLHKNHLNKFNLYNQVSIMAFNIIGDVQNERGVRDHEAVAYYESGHKNPDYVSPMDDLAFDLYQDPEVAKIIRRLDARKNVAVKEENFDAAKKMKQAIADLRKVGEKLARYELDKRKAVEDEDYDLAKSKKAQMEEYRLKVYQQLRNYGLVEEAGIEHYMEMERPLPLPVLADEPEPRIIYPSPRASNEIVEESSIYPETTLPLETPQRYEELPPVQEILHSVEEKPQEPEIEHIEPPPIVTQSYDEKVIPALKKRQPEAQPVEERESQPFDDGSPQRVVPGGEPEPMSEKSIREASSAIDVFGLPLVSQAYSKTFSFREDALLAIYKKLNEIPTTLSKDEVRAYLRATVFLLKKLVRDKVHSVFVAVLRLLELVLTHFIPEHKLGKAEVNHVVNQTLPQLIQKTGESAARARNGALDFIVKLATFSNVKPLHLVTQTAVQPFNRDMATRLALGRVEIMNRLIKSIGLEPPAMTAESVMQFCLRALEHTSGAVRDAACQVIYQVYRIAGEIVKKCLPADEPATRKNLLYRNIFDNLDHIDGKPTQAELKAQQQAQNLENERKKREEILQLQSQIEQLRKINPQQDNKKQTAKSKKDSGDNQAVEATQYGDEASAYLENMCIFCGERDNSFNDEGLDMHYWKNCPMLKRCEHCKQVVEIAGYTEHLLSECEKSNLFGKCERCSEAIPKTELQKHVSEKKCAISKPDKQNRCPMCHRNIPLGEDSWKLHLMGSDKDACSANARRLPSLNRLKNKQAGGNSQVANKKKNVRA